MATGARSKKSSTAVRKIPPARGSGLLPAPASSAELTLKGALRRERQTSDALRQVASALGDVTDSGELLALVLDKSREVTSAARATLYLVDERTGGLVSVRSSGQLRTTAPLSVAIGQGVAGRVAKSGKAMIVSDTSRHLRFLGAVDKQLGVRTRNMLCVPMRDNAGKVHGVIQVVNRARGSFTKADAATLQALATQAAVSIVQVNLVTSLRYESAELSATKEELERRVRDLHLLFDLERAMARVESLEELLLSALREAKKVTLASRAMFLIRDPETDALSLFIQGENRATLERHPVKGALGLLGHAMNHDETTRSDEAEADPRGAIGEARAVLHEEGSALCVPLEGDDGRTLGAIGLYGKMLGFDEEDEAIVLLVCANVATALRLHWSRESREREERLTTIGRLLSGVIHDLKTPLSVISGYVQLMQSADSRSKRDEYARLMVKQFEHVFAMQRDVLEFARGERSILQRKVYLAQFFEGVRAELEHVLAKSGVDLELELLDRGTARFDEGKILRVIHNLARNAAEAMMAQGGGTFTIRVAKNAAGALVLTFFDTGPGIPKEIEHKLFQLVRHEREERRYGSWFGHRETHRRRARRRRPTELARRPRRHLPHHAAAGPRVKRALAVLLLASTAQADPLLPPWTEPGDIPISGRRCTACA